jgi:NAD(P)H-dependent flavin oxidoreductase YrpB (nitropropane dioxygenase family)
MGNIVTRFTERFGCKHPFACAGMAFAGMTDLALAVCRGGGVGAIGVGLMPAEQLRAMIHEMRKQTTAPFNVNLITFFDNDAQIRVCAEERVPVVSFHWGHPSTEHIKLLRDAGVSIWEQIGTVDAARTALGDDILGTTIEFMISPHAAQPLPPHSAEGASQPIIRGATAFLSELASR